MALTAHLKLRQSQSLVMTPQLMQSIQLLQMTHAELQQFIATEMERNPLLELAAGPGDDSGGDEGAASEATADAPQTGAPEPAGDWLTDNSRTSAETLSEQLDSNFGDSLAGDDSTGFGASAELTGSWKSVGEGTGGDGFDPDDFSASTESLSALIERQIALSFASDADRFTARMLAGGLDEAGYLDPGMIEETARQLGQPGAAVERVLGILQGFDPPGIFARSLSECLSIQLRARDRLTPAMSALLANLDLLARRDFVALGRICGTGAETLLSMFAELRRLNPKPGAGIGSSDPETLIPDVTVRPGSDGAWQVELNGDALPRVLVNRRYYAEVSASRGSTQDDRLFLSECLQTANWLTRSLDQRAQTILKVAREIVRQQDGFLAEGIRHLRPLTLRAVADAISMHESTVSRVTANKYIATPRGVFEMKYFFTAAIASADDGDAHSAESVRHRIAQLIRDEDPQAVLSDDDLVDRLKEGGIEIARRTVAKYREALGLSSSVQRRREKRAAAGF